MCEDPPVPAYTLTVWRVKPGRDDDFVAAWHALAQWTIENGYEVKGTLLRDHEHAGRYVSFGLWRSADSAGSWRVSSGYSEHVARLEETLDGFEPGLFELVMDVS